MTDNNHSHLLLWICIFACILTITFLFAFICFGGIEYIATPTTKEYVFKSESFYGCIASLIGVCTTIMLGAQVYSVYTRTQAEKGYHNKLKEIEKWFHSSTDKHEKELENLIKAHRSLDKLKYCVNDALACMHYKDDKKFEGIIDVMENIYTIINNEDLFKEDYREKLDVACYFIAKNLKEYKTDITFKQKDSVAIIRILGRWNKRYNQINFKQDSAQYIQQKIKNLDKVIDTLFHNLVNNNFSYTMSDYDWNLLCQIATN